MLSARASRALLAALALAAPLAACGGEEAKRVKTLAGTYAYESETDPRTDPSGMHVHQRKAVTLRRDGHWVMTYNVTMNGDPMPGAVDSGTFRVQGVTLALNSEEEGVQQYTVKGDTLWAQVARQLALTKQITGMDIKVEDSFLVRER